MHDSFLGLAGLRFFQRQETDPKWAVENVWQWPHVSVAIDLGSDGVTGFFALQQRFKLNIELHNDRSHRSNCDHDLLCKALRMKSIQALLYVCFNLPHGPRKGEDLRLWQFTSCLRKFYKEERPDTMPLFMARLPGLIKCLARMDVTLPNVKSVEEEVSSGLRTCFQITNTLFEYEHSS